MNRCLFSLALIYVLCSSACKEKCNDPTNTACPNFDPCYEITERPAHFNMTLLLKGRPDIDTYISMVDDGDVVYYYNTLHLTAQIEGATSYLWQIGYEADPREGKDIYVSFDYPWGEVPITLMVAYEDANNCYPQYSGYDTLTQTINLSAAEGMPYWGKYFGYFNDDVADTATIELMLMPPPHCFGCDSIFPHLFNFPVSDCEHGIDRLDMGGDDFAFYASIDIRCLRAGGLASSEDGYQSITIAYWRLENEDSDDLVFETYQGNRVE